MESEFNPFVWAYMLVQDEKKWKRSATEMALFYSKFHNWSQQFEDDVILEIQNLRNKN